ncbi:MAG: TRAP transporter large permease subunit [Deltaproteobacteria bacterium]|nr:TRAP transporter large permease subunit [Deltaproteobacteria bacterium]
MLNLKIEYNDDRRALDGFILPLYRIEHWFNKFTKLLLFISQISILAIPIPILVDIIGRYFFSTSLIGISDIETQALIIIIFGAIPYVTASRANIVIDIFYNKFNTRFQNRLLLFSYALCTLISGVLAWKVFMAGVKTIAYTPMLHLPEGLFMKFCAFSLGMIAVGMFFQSLHTAKDLLADRDIAGMVLFLTLVFVVFFAPNLFKLADVTLPKIVLGLLGFVFLFILLFLRVPIGIGMACVGILGLLILMPNPIAAWSLIADVPYREQSSLVLIAIPMFMIMGEITSVSTISNDMFDCANKWLGRLPGGLAVASVGGCACFGAICGDSLSTVVAMSTVSLPQMREKNYSQRLAAGALASGGTLGILIPPSMGFIFYSIMTEESIGRLFVAGIVPGIVLAIIFFGIIIYQVKRNPSLAPVSEKFTIQEKMRSLLGLIPVIILFMIVVGGIMYGFFSPGEGGAVGAACALFYALCRRQIDVNGVFRAFFNTSLMAGKIFMIMIGVFIFGVFLARSRLPALLAEFVVGLEMNRYIILVIVIFIYIFMGCVMNIIPMMLLTLPSIYPTIQSLGFDGIWFGVITVIVMEMGLITPPIGLNVFTMSSLAPDIGIFEIFKGVLPFFLGMILCVILVILFPQLALWLPGILV